MAKAMCKTMAFIDRHELVKIKCRFNFFQWNLIWAVHVRQVTDLL